MKTIHGIDALKQMRALRHDESAYFVMHHLTWQDKRQQTDGMRIVRHCRLRAALPEDSMKPHPDLFLPYIDLDQAKINQNRMCRKRLIRFVAFPPAYELMKVDFNKPYKDGKAQIINNA